MSTVDKSDVNEPEGSELGANEFEVIVVGGGVAGSAAALRAGQYHLRTAWLVGDAGTRKASRGEYVYNLDNMIGIHPGPMLRKVNEVLAGDEHAAARERLAAEHFHLSTGDVIENVSARLAADYASFVERVEQRVVEVERADGRFVARTSEGREFRAPALVLATGVMDLQPRIKQVTKSGKVIDEVHWIYPYANNETLLYCIRCEGHLTRNVRTAVVGSSETAAQIALMLHERYDTPAVLLTNGEEPTFGADTGRLLAAYDIPVHTARITSIVDGGAKPKGSSLRGFTLEDGTEVEASYGMVSMGLHRVYNDLARALGADLEESSVAEERRHVLVEDATSETSVPGLFCVGDMAKRRDGGPLMKQVYTAQEYAVRAIDTVDRRRRALRRKALLGTAPA